MSERLEGTVREMVGRAQQKAGEVVGDTSTQAEGMYQQAAGRAQWAMGQAQDTAEQVSKVIRGQPLLAAAIALGVGYLIGRLTA